MAICNLQYNSVPDCRVLGGGDVEIGNSVESITAPECCKPAKDCSSDFNGGLEREYLPCLPDLPVQ
jgi:hypothetical protein